MDRLDVWLASGLLVAATAIRAPGLNPSSLWLDDAWVALVDKVDQFGVVLRMGVTAPGFMALEKAMFSLFGFSELAAQAWPFLAAIAAPPAVFFVARRWGAGRLPAVLGGAVVALAPLHVTYSTNAKQYTLDLVIGLALVYAASRVLEDPTQDRLRRLALGAAMATFFSASVGPIAVVAAVTPALPALRQRQWTAGLWPAAYMLYAVFLALVMRRWIPDVLPEFWQEDLSRSPLDPVFALADVVTDFTGHPLLAAGVGVLLVFGIVGLAWWQRVLLLGPLAVAGFASFAGVPLGTGRTDIYLYGILALGVALMIDRLVTWPAAQAVVLLAVVAAMGWPLPQSGYGDPDQFMHSDTRPLIEEIVSDLNDDAQILTIRSHFVAALYGPWQIKIHDAPNSTTGWWPVIQDERVVNVMGFPSTPARLRRHFPDMAAERVHMLASRVPHEILEEAEVLLAGQGYVSREVHQRPGATWVVYERNGP